ncbi:MAG: DNA polymerase III subunit delta [bacterium]|nr:DNA polymerase III subunit delta [bacterium]
MPSIPFFDCLDRIKRGNETFPVIVLHGFNEFLGEKIIRSLTNTFLEEKTDFNYRRFYFDSEYNETNWEEIISEANSSSFFVQSRKVLVATIRDGKKITLLKHDKQLLADYIKQPNANTILVIYFSLNMIKDDFKQLKKQKIDKFLKETVSPNSFHVDMDKISEIEFKRYVTRYFKEIGMTITASALDKIIEIKEEDYLSVLYQLPRLEVADVENHSIDSEDVEKVVTGVEAHSIWDLTDAIEAENSARYLKVLKYLFLNGIQATLIIGTLVTHYNKIYIAKFLLKSHVPIDQIGKVLGQHPYFLNKFIQSARRFSDKRLQHILKMIYDLDYESKTSGEGSARLSLENFTFRSKLFSESRL